MRRALRMVLATLLAITAMTVVRSPAQAPNDDLRLLRVRSSLLGRHHWYQQTYRGVDVLDGGLARHVHYSGDTRTRDYRKGLGRDIDVTPSVTAAAAASAAGPFVVRTDLAIVPGSDPRLVWAVLTEPPTGTARTLVDAHSGEIISIARIARDFDGMGRVFNPNPVVTLRDQSLRDLDDADYAALHVAYQIVPLTHLDGTGYLRGDFTRIGYDDAQTAFSPSNTFEYGRSSTFFSQTMTYYHITTAQEYIQSLGFTDINNRAQVVYPDAMPDDNSWYSPADTAIYYGTGGVDDAEDADVVLHEYGHAIQEDQVPGFYGGRDDTAIAEGFADYWAVTVSQPANGGYEVPCVFDWDSVEIVPTEPHCLRRIDTELTVADRTFINGHFDGQIWSRALWDTNQSLGRDIANTIVLEAQFDFWPAMTFDEAARTTVTTARGLFGAAAARIVYQAFARRGLIQLPNAVARSTHQPSLPGFREVARLAPPGSDDPYVDVFEVYGLDDAGNALFATDVNPWGQGVFVAGHRGTTEILRSLNAAPGGGTLGFGVLAGPGLGAAGRVAASFLLLPLRYPWGRNSGVYASSQSGIQPVVVPGVTPAPGGGTFVGSAEMTAINGSGTIAFSGMILTPHGISAPYGIGVFVASPAGDISTVAAPGDAAPGGGTFDFVAHPAINENGDIAFAGHPSATPCLWTMPQTRAIGCVTDLYVKRSRTTTIERVAAVGEAAPGGGMFRDISFPVINAAGDILFRAVLDVDSGLAAGYFLSRAGQIIPIARTGDTMPGGGTLTVVPSQPGNWDLNDRGDVAFSAAVDTFDGPWGSWDIADQGLYTWSDGVLSLVVRSGDSLPGGEIVALQPTMYLGAPWPFSGAQINDVREVLFAATVVDDPFVVRTVLYVKK